MISISESRSSSGTVFDLFLVIRMVSEYNADIILFFLETDENLKHCERSIIR